MATIVITGCDTGLGVEFARQYAAEGHRVHATCLDPERAAATRAIPGDVVVSKLDVTDHAAIEAFATELGGAPVDVLVHNAAIARPHPSLGATDYPLFRRILETNLIGPMKLSECLVENVARSELRMIAFVSSRMGSIALNLSGGSYAYRSSKAGLNMIAKTLAVDLAPRKISVIALHPGWADSEAGGRVPVAESVAGMRGVLHRAGANHTGVFQTYHDQPLPW